MQSREEGTRRTRLPHYCYAVAFGMELPKTKTKDLSGNKINAPKLILREFITPSLPLLLFMPSHENSDFRPLKNSDPLGV